MIQKLRKILAGLIWRNEPPLIFVRYIIPFDRAHAYREYEDMARNELRNQHGDISTFVESSITRSGGGFAVSWQCEAADRHKFSHGHVMFFRDGEWQGPASTPQRLWYR